MSKSGSSIAYGYNADGKRISKTVNGTTYNYAYLGDALTDLSWGSNRMHFTYDSIGPASVTYNGTTYLYVKNAHLIAKLEALCGDSDFTIIKEYDNYTITIIVDLEMFGQVDELDYIIESMIPCNMIVISRNEIPCKASGFALFSGGICFVQDFFINDEDDE